MTDAKPVTEPTAAELAHRFRDHAANVREDRSVVEMMFMTADEAEQVATALLSLRTVTEQRDQSDAIVAMMDGQGAWPYGSTQERVDELNRWEAAAIERNRSRQSPKEGT